jgi:Carboxypeptidase regulatory-like domain
MSALLRAFAVVFAGAAIAGAQPPPGPPGGLPARDSRRPSAQTGSAIVRGRVIAADTGRPLRRARVTLAAAELGRDGRTASTDAEGRYEVGDLPAGGYSLRVARSGYLSLQYGQRRPLEQGKPLQLADKQTLESIDFALPRTSVIRGLILDETNEPAGGVSVIAMRLSYWQGRRRMVPTGAPVQTDDGGEYRISNLSPGTYFVMAQLRDTWTARHDGVTESMGYAPTYFPGTASVPSARRITVGIGEVVGAIDFSLIPGRAATIAGTAVDSLGRPLVNRLVAIVQPLVGPGFGMMMGAGSATSNADGSFTIRNIPPGQYKLQAQTTRETQTIQGTVLEVATTPITVDGGDLVNLLVRTTMGWMASGRVTAEDGRPPDAPHERFGVAGRLVDTDQSPFGGAPPPPPPPGGSGAVTDSGRVKDDWTFVVTPIFGAARLRVSVPDGWRVEAILHDGRDISDAAVEMKSGDELSGVHVIVTSRVTTIAGQVVDKNGAAQADGTVVLFADDADKWSEDSRWVRAVRTDSQGQYQVRGLPPGEYLAVALEYAEDGIWNDPEYLGALRHGARKVTLREGQTSTMALTLERVQ